MSYYSKREKYLHTSVLLAMVMTFEMELVKLSNQKKKKVGPPPREREHSKGEWGNDGKECK